MNKKRFAKLIKAVEERPEERFDMRHWGRKSPCGTICCAFGSYIEANPSRGFSLEPSMAFDMRMNVVRGGRTLPSVLGAAADEFEITEGDADRLFVLFGTF